MAPRPLWRRKACKSTRASCTGENRSRAIARSSGCLRTAKGGEKRPAMATMSMSAGRRPALLSTASMDCHGKAFDEGMRSNEASVATERRSPFTHSAAPACQPSDNPSTFTGSPRGKCEVASTLASGHRSLDTCGGAHDVLDVLFGARGGLPVEHGQFRIRKGQLRADRAQHSHAEGARHQVIPP